MAYSADPKAEAAGSASPGSACRCAGRAGGRGRPSPAGRGGRGGGEVRRLSPATSSPRLGSQRPPDLPTSPSPPRPRSPRGLRPTATAAAEVPGPAVSSPGRPGRLRFQHKLTRAPLAVAFAFPAPAFRDTPVPRPGCGGRAVSSRSPRPRRDPPGLPPALPGPRLPPSGSFLQKGGSTWGLPAAESVLHREVMIPVRKGPGSCKVSLKMLLIRASSIRKDNSTVNLTSL